MSDDEFAAIIGTVDQQLINAQACLDLFEKDRGRRVAVLDAIEQGRSLV